MTDIVGARASNAGDDYHELWAVRQAIRLLSNEGGLAAITVEGVGNEVDGPADTWSGVDCTLYFGGTTLSDATHVEIVQVKYSTTKPKQSWTVRRLVRGGKGKCVFSKLAKAWKKIVDNPTSVVPTVALVSNQPVSAKLERTVRQMATATAPAAKGTIAEQLARVTGLNAQDLPKFASSFSFKCDAGSRPTFEEKILRSIGEWTDGEIGHVASSIQDLVHRQTMPDTTGERITKESVLACLSVSTESTLFPCPSQINLTTNPVHRAVVTEATETLQDTQYVCLHGEAGVGKTTALQELEYRLPEGSVVVTYDCYGAGRYKDPSALRHQMKDALLQITNEIALRLELPLFLVPKDRTNYPREFMRRLRYAAAVLHDKDPQSLVVVAIDAADNAVFAARSRHPDEVSFIDDFVKLTDLPNNVRFVLTARTGRLQYIQLPSKYRHLKVPAFDVSETKEFVSRVWRSVPPSWIKDFHYLSNGNPRVQATAFESAGQDLQKALSRLMPYGKELKDIFSDLFQNAILKSGTESTLTRFCAALVALPRPVPLGILASVLDESKSAVRDICLDLMPGIVCHEDLITFADEDLEEFVRAVGADSIEEVLADVAALLFDIRDDDEYAASNVAEALLAADRRSELLDLVRLEPAPSDSVIRDPTLRREIELRRLRLAISVCREAKDTVQTLRYILSGVESIQTESALRTLLVDNPDLAVRFAEESVRRLVLSDPLYVDEHGHFLFHRLAEDARLEDRISERRGRLRVRAWLQARDARRERQSLQHKWDMDIVELSSMFEATLRLYGPDRAATEIAGWPADVRLEVGLVVPWTLIADGCAEKLAALVNDHLNPAQSLFILVPLGLSGREYDTAVLVEGLRRLLRRRRSYEVDPREVTTALSLRGRVANVLVSGAEMLVAKGVAKEVARCVLDAVLAGPLSKLRSHSVYQVANLDLLLRAYTLRETLGGGTPTVDAMFGNDDARYPHDRQGRVKELAMAAIDVYASVADALVRRQEPEEDLFARLSNDRDALSRYPNVGLRGHLAAHVCILLLLDYEPDWVWRNALRVHGDWQDGSKAPSDDFIARVRVWPALHERLIERVGVTAGKARAAKLPTQDKVSLLTQYSRILAPISPPDAKAIFASAMEVVGQLDVDILEGIRLFDSFVRPDTCGVFPAPRYTAIKIAKVIEESALRLKGYGYFPWGEAISALARLDLPLALAAVARWADEDVGQLSETLPPLLKAATAVDGMRPEQVAAIMLFLDKDVGISSEVLGCASERVHAELSEEIAQDAVMRSIGHPSSILRAATTRREGIWIPALQARADFFASLVPVEPPSRGISTTQDRDPGLRSRPHAWKQEELTEADSIEEVIRQLDDGLRWLDVAALLDAAREVVAPRDRVAHLEALSDLSHPTIAADTVPRAILRAVGAWSKSPSVDGWARERLPHVIRRRFAEFVSYPRDTELLRKALELAGLAEPARDEIILRGIERSVGVLPVSVILALVHMVAADLEPLGASQITDWYAGHLEERIETGQPSGARGYGELPGNVDEAVARFLFCHLGDCDLRLRWRAAHAVRRLARIGDDLTLDAIAQEYQRREDPEFRSRECPFYWLAARLWFVISFDAVARERPLRAAPVTRLLVDIALDATLPHVLIRSFARDACEKLVKSHQLVLTRGQRKQLKLIDGNHLPRRKRTSRTDLTGFDYQSGEYRFQFDVLDTLPYWYDPMLRSFSELSADRFLEVVERWIVDRWRFESDVWVADEGRKHRFERNSALADNGHGAIPTVERVREHLEWHAMWCALGEFLATEPLAEAEYFGDDLSHRIDLNRLGAPPAWSADVACPTPLEARYWYQDDEPLEQWIDEVEEDVFLGALVSADPRGYFCVHGSSNRKMSDREEATQVRSAFVERGTGKSLVRALQTMDDSWDYRIPFELDSMGGEFDVGPFRLRGWLRWTDYDSSSGIDGKDPFRAFGFGVLVRPGEHVVETCKLRAHEDRPVWTSRGTKGDPMFVYQTWGSEDDFEGTAEGHFAVSGYRLLAQTRQLRDFLRGSEWDLVVKVEVTRRDKKRRRFDPEGEDEGRSRTTRVYRFGVDGRLEDAKGLANAWANDS